MIYILDSYGLIFRSYYAFVSRPLINEQGQNISAVFGFFRNLLSVLKNERPNFFVAVFDPPTPTFRHIMYPEYKANRDETPKDLHAQVPIIEEVLAALGIKKMCFDGFEADDVIATLVKNCEKSGKSCRILSNDKDLMQLVSDNTYILRPSKMGGWETVDSNVVEAEWGVKPQKMLDILSLIGDSADNIPGVVGVGPKTAIKLLTQYSSLDEIYENAQEIGGAIGEKIRNGKENAYFSQNLIKLRYDVPISETYEGLCCQELNFVEAAKILYKYGVRQVAKEYAAMAETKIADVVNKNDFSNDEADERNIFAKSLENESLENDEIQNDIIENNIFVSDIEQGIPLKKNEGKYYAITDLPSLTKIVDKILDIGSCAFDCETDGLETWKCQIVGFSLCYTKAEAYYVPLGRGMDLFSTEGISKKEAFEQLRRIFCIKKDMKIIMHNGKFDLKVLSAHGMFQNAHGEKIPLTAQIIDTMVACWLLESDRTSFSLDNLSERKLGIETIPYKEIVPKNATFFDVPLEIATKYAAEDADLTWQLWQLFEPALKKSGLDKLFWELEMPILLILANMEENGIYIEKDELSKYSSELSSQIEKLQNQIYEMVGYEFNIASPKQLQEVLFVDRKLQTSKKIKTGFSTDTSVLEELALIDEVPATILDYRGVTKLLSTYVDALPVLADNNSRIHTNFIQTGTATGRLSSREPNLQNIPVRNEAGRRIRMAFSAPKGRVLVSADYSQIELVILAHLSQDVALCNAFNSGIDVHKSTASLIFGVDMENVSADMRRTAKTINFGVMYGMSAFRLAKELKITRTQATDFIKMYFATYSGVRTFLDTTISHCEKNGFVETIMNRRRYIAHINSRNKIEKATAERIAINTPIQGSAADIVKKAMIAVYDNLSQKFPSAKMLLQVHDELICECNEKDGEKVAQLIKESMEKVVKLNIPLKASVEVGQRWGQFH